MSDSSHHLENTDELPVLSEEAASGTAGENSLGLLATLNDAIATLQATLEQTEARWQSLEARFDAQYQALLELTETLDRGLASATAGSGERKLLERIAGLEGYVTGRAEKWRAMESDLDDKTQRIAELERELARRGNDRGD